MDVGVRELKNHLSQYLAKVEVGGEVTVTDRGRAVARLIPIGTARTIDRLVAEGLVTRSHSSKRPAPAHRVHSTEPVSPLVAEQRR